MNRLPKKYFKSITDYVMTYYTADGVTKYAPSLNSLLTRFQSLEWFPNVDVRFGFNERKGIDVHIYCRKPVSFFNSLRDIRFTGLALYFHNGELITNLRQAFANFGGYKIHIDRFYGISGPYMIYDSNGKNPMTIESFEVEDSSSSMKGNLNYMFHGTKRLKEIPAIDLSGATVLKYFCNDNNSCARFGGYDMRVSINLDSLPLAHDAILEVFNNLGSGVGEGTTLTLGSAKLALMSDEEKKIATDKGWTLA